MGSSIRFAHAVRQRVPPVLLLVYADAGQARRLSYDLFMPASRGLPQQVLKRFAQARMTKLKTAVEQLLRLDAGTR